MNADLVKKKKKKNLKHNKDRLERTVGLGVRRVGSEVRFCHLPPEYFVIQRITESVYQALG